MDIIQRTVSLFSELVQKVRSIGNMLITNYLPVTSSVEKSIGIFWIFNW